MTYIDGAIVGGLFAVGFLLTLFIRDDNAAPDIPEGEPSTGGADTDDDLDLTWSLGVGDWR